uniref:codanin-1-like n=1 Tax=Myxine glutinosa TaxID=7769 RepID=UPI00358F8661
MAESLLASLLNGEIQPAGILSWLGVPPARSCPSSPQVDFVKAEPDVRSAFVPLLLQFVRDQICTVVAGTDERKKERCGAATGGAQTTAPKINLDNLEEFPPVGQARQCKPSRRINPTRVCEDRQQSQPTVSFVQTPFDINERVSFVPEIQRGTAGHLPEREMLCRERDCRLWRCSAKESTSGSLSRLDTSCTSSASSHPLSQSSTAHSSLPCSAPHSKLLAAPSLNSSSQPSVQKQPQSPLIPHPEAVTNSSELQNLAVVFAGCIRGNLVPNVLLEVYLVLHLLSVHSNQMTHFKPSQVTGRPDELLRSYLISVHNCVFFAVCVLAELTRFLTLLDHGTLRLLSESKLIESFSPHLHRKLAAALPQALKQTPCCPRTAHSSLPFQLETENHATFSTNRTFQTFKKQRDQLFILIREWEDNHSKPRWDFEQNMGLRVRAMMLQLTH